jgi:biotin operon repressor
MISVDKHGHVDTKQRMQGVTTEAPRRALLKDLPEAERERAAVIVAACHTSTLEPRVPNFHGRFPQGAFLAIEGGFVVLRASTPAASRSIITCEAGPGRIVLPPSPDEVLVALTKASVTAIDVAARNELLRLPSFADLVVDQLSFALRQKQEAIANLASPRHVERVRLKLLQLAQGYGHVVRDGIRIDFPLSHALLAQMIASSRETVTRALDELERSGFVVREGGSYRLLGPAEALLAPARSSAFTTPV